MTASVNRRNFRVFWPTFFRSSGRLSLIACVLSVRLRRSLVTLFLAEIDRSRVRRTVGHVGFRPR